MLIILTLIGSICLALWSTLNAKYVRDGSAPGVTCGWSSTFVLSRSFLSASLYMALFWVGLWFLGKVHLPTGTVFWTSFAITVFINILFEIFRFKAYGLADLGLVASFSGLAPILTILTSWILLRELPSIIGVVGIILVAISIYFLNFNDSLNWKNLLKPFRSIWNNRGTRYAFFAALPPALSIVYDKKAVIESDPITFSLLAYVAIGIVTAIIAHFESVSKPPSLSSKPPLIKFLKIGFFHFMASVSFNAMFFFTLVPYVSALRRCVIIFEVLFAYYLLHQRFNIKQRLLAAAGIFAGLILISLVP